MSVKKPKIGPESLKMTTPRDKTLNSNVQQPLPKNEKKSGFKILN